ncbi:hypothetical protein G7054_g11859 [Neopestalotiopsis clavispora]|nr:hypothetical protein G7054_g11859 [Neopestalotiopsis clavispora]
MAHELSKRYPYAEYENQRICSRYMPHAEAILAITETTIDQELKAELLEKVGRSYTQLGEDDIAKQKHEEAWQLRQTVLGPSHEDTLISLHSLAITLTDLGRYKQAEQMYRSVLRLRKRGLGRKHPDTLASEDDLGHVLYLLENYDEAERYHLNALNLRRLELGDDHVDTLHSKNNLALVLGALGKYKEAEQAHREQQELCVEKFGPSHPETLCSMNNRALMMRELGQHKQARALFQKCLSLRREELGPEHPHTLNTLNNLALVLGDLGELEEAAQMHREELRLCEKRLGSEHPDALISMKNLAFVLEKAAKQISRRAEELRQKSHALFDMRGFDERGLDRPATRSSYIRPDLEITFISTSNNDVDDGLKATRPTTVAKQVPSTGFNAGEKATSVKKAGSVNPDGGNDQLQPQDDVVLNGLEAKSFAGRFPAYERSRFRGDIGRSLTIGGFIFVMIAAINFLKV